MHTTYINLHMSTLLMCQGYQLATRSLINWGHLIKFYCTLKLILQKKYRKIKSRVGYCTEYHSDTLYFYTVCNCSLNFFKLLLCREMITDTLTSSLHMLLQILSMKQCGPQLECKCPKFGNQLPRPLRICSFYFNDRFTKVASSAGAKRKVKRKTALVSYSVSDAI